MLTELLAVLGLAGLFVLYGLLNRGRRRACGSGCACPALTTGCERADGAGAGRESPHAEG
jgi:hypothetical protein